MPSDVVRMACTRPQNSKVWTSPSNGEQGDGKDLGSEVDYVRRRREGEEHVRPITFFS